MVKTATRRRVALGALGACLSLTAIVAPPTLAKTLQGNGSSSSGEPTPVPNGAEAPTPYIVPPAAPAPSPALATTSAPEPATAEPEVPVERTPAGATPQEAALRPEALPVPVPTATLVSVPAQVGPPAPRSTAFAGPLASPRILALAPALRPTISGPTSNQTSTAGPTRPISPTSPTTVDLAAASSSVADTTPAPSDTVTATSAVPIASAPLEKCPPLPEVSPPSSAWTAVGVPGLLAGTVHGSAKLPSGPTDQGGDSALAVFITRRGTADVLGVYRGVVSPSGSFNAAAACTNDQVDALHQGEAEAHLVIAENGKTIVSPPVALNVLAGPALPR